MIRNRRREAIRLAKTLMRTARHGAIAVLDPRTGGPLASRVGVATDADGAPLILVSGFRRTPRAIDLPIRAARCCSAIPARAIRWPIRALR